MSNKTHKHVSKILAARKPLVFAYKVDALAPIEANTLTAVFARMVKTINPAAVITGGYTYNLEENERENRKEIKQKIQSWFAKVIHGSQKIAAPVAAPLVHGGDLPAPENTEVKK